MYIYIAHHIYIHLKVHWTKGQKKLHETDRKIFTKKAGRNTLHIRNVQPSDFGNYSCRADNDLGKARTYTSLSGKFHQKMIALCNSLNITYDDYNANI